MKRYYYDLHIHSCLSPCGDDDNTPNNIAGMASLSELDIVALTDHNSTKNCPAFFKAAEKYGITPIAGMELTTSEDIHVVCLFEFLDDAMKFDEYISNNRLLIKNRPEFFGDQLILDSEDNIIGKEENLLTGATNISIDGVNDVVKMFNGVCFPAHIDRDSNGIIAILGTIPCDSEFTYYEMHDSSKIDEYCEKYRIDRSKIVISTDSHNLSQIKDKQNYFLLECETSLPDEIRKKLFELLRS